MLTYTWLWWLSPKIFQKIRILTPSSVVLIITEEIERFKSHFNRVDAQTPNMQCSIQLSIFRCNKSYQSAAQNTKLLLFFVVCNISLVPKRKLHQLLLWLNSPFVPYWNVYMVMPLSWIIQRNWIRNWRAG